MELQKHEYKLDKAIGKISIVYLPFVNYVLSINHIPVFDKLFIENESDKDWHNIVVELSGDMLLQSISRIDSIVSGQSIDLSQSVAIDVNVQKLAELTESQDTMFAIKVTIDDNVIFEKEFEINLQAYDQWIGSAIRPDLLASFVTPNHPLISKVIGNARSILKRLTGSDSFNAYQSGDANRVRCQAAAIYESLRGEGLSYITPPASFEILGQRVRLVDKVLEEKLGTCLDLSLLYASCLEAIGLNPLLILIKGHCFVGCWLVRDSYSHSVGDDANFLLKASADGISEIVVMEATCLTNPDPVSFEDSSSQALRHLAIETEFECYIDVFQARVNKVRPIPLRLRQSDGSWQIINNGSEHDVSAGKIKVLDRFDLSNYDSNPAEVTRYTIWERKLLDFSLRNTLLNIRMGRRVIPLLSFGIDRLEDFLQDGQSFNIRPFPLNSAPVTGERGIFESSIYPSIEQLVLDGFHQRRLYSFLQEEDLDNGLKYVYRASRTSMEENGANNLYMVLGLLKWFEAEQASKPHFAPLLLLPIEIVRTLGGGGYTIRARDEEVSLNITLVELLRQQHDIDLSLLNELPKDDHGVDVKKILAIIRDKIRDKKGWNVLDESLIGLFSFNKFVMWNDIHANSDKLHQHDIISSLLEGRLNVAEDDLGPIDIRSIDHEMAPAEYAIPLDVDSSQLEAVIASGEGKSFILHGPPGTGKSQTITNIIANALYQGKRVLFVAEKMAALEVVQSRLSKIGLAPFCLELHSNKATKQHFLHQLDEALNVVRGKESAEYAELSKKVFDERKEILKYVEALHKPDTSGFTLYDCIDQYFSVLDCDDAICFDESKVDEYTPEMLSEAIDMISRMEPVLKIVGSPDKHPLSGLNICEDFENAERQIKLHVPETAKWLKRFKELSYQFNEIWGFEAPDMECDNEEMKLFNSLLQAPILSKNLVGLILSPDKIEALLEAVASESEYIRKSAGITARYSADYLTLDTVALRGKWREAESKWFIPRHFAIKKFLRQLPSSSNPVSFAEFPLIANEIESLNALHDRYKPYEGELMILFGKAVADGNKWQLIDSSLIRAKALADFIKQINGRYSVIASAENIEKIVDVLRNMDESALRKAISLNEKIIEANKNASSHFNKYWDFLCSYGGDLGELTQVWSDNMHLLKDWTLFRKRLGALADFVGDDCWDQLSAPDPINHTIKAVKKGFFQVKIKKIIESYSTLNYFNSLLIEDIIKRYRELAIRLRDVSKKAVLCRVASNLPSMTMNTIDTSELGILKRNIKSGGRGKSIRSIIDMIPTLLPKLCPCMLMSPISVAQYISLNAPKFDLVIFDEASQMPTSEAVGAIARGKALIVVGDPKQMPPTSFFSTSAVGEDEAHVDDMESILDDCITMSFPSKYLTWHYRSRHESLITFSNHQYYGGKLTTFPSVDNLTSKVSLRYINGVYDRSRTRRNKIEAEAIVAELLRRLSDETLAKRSIGIVAFSKVQQDMIEDLLISEFSKHPDLESLAYSNTEPIFVKNLENVQGDERDVILFSVGYGPDKEGKVSMNFGPLNNAGGERRLNVAVSRSRYEMVVFSSLRPDQIDLRRTNSLGVAGLKSFLEFASIGNAALIADRSKIKQDHVLSTLCNAIKNAGYDFDINVGSSNFRIDIAVKDPEEPSRYILGILIDGHTYFATPTVRDREIVQPSILRHLEWNIMRVWTVDYLNRPENFIQNLRNQIDKLLAEKHVRAISDAQDSENPETATSSLVEVKSQEIPQKEIEVPHVVNNQCINYPIVDSTPVAMLSNADELYSYFPELSNLLMDIISKEAPITDSLLYKRVVKSFGLTRVSSKVQLAVNGVLHRLPVFVQPNSLKGKVYWSKEFEWNGYDKYRINSGRDISDVPFIEIENAMLYVLSQQIALDAEDLKRLTANQLGYNRKGSNIEAITTEVLNKLHQCNRLRLESQKVMQV